MSREIRRTGSPDECCGYDPYQDDPPDPPTCRMGICTQCETETLIDQGLCLACSVKELRASIVRSQFQASLTDPRR